MKNEKTDDQFKPQYNWRLPQSSCQECETESSYFTVEDESLISKDNKEERQVIVDPDKTKLPPITQKKPALAPVMSMPNLKRQEGELHLKGGRYIGEIVNKQPHGKGRIEFNNGTSYEGDFYWGAMHGYGTFNMLSGDKYIGQLHQNNVHGEGKMEYGNGDVYEGHWRYGERHGQGKMTFNDGYVYEGMFRNNEMNGKGRLSFPDGSVYLGEFLHGTM